MHTSRHTRKTSSFSTQDEHPVLLGLEALTAVPNLRYATRSTYIETRNAYGEAVDDSRHPGWDGPPPKHYQKHDAEKLRAHLQLWEPEARVVMHLDGA